MPIRLFLSRMCYFLAVLVTSFDSRLLLWELLHVSEPDNPYLEAFVSQADWSKFHNVVLAHCLHHTLELVLSKAVHVNNLAISRNYPCVHVCKLLLFISQFDIPCHFYLINCGTAHIFLFFSLTPFAAYLSGVLIDEIVLRITITLCSKLPSILFPFLKFE